MPTPNYLTADLKQRATVAMLDLTAKGVWFDASRIADRLGYAKGRPERQAVSHFVKKVAATMLRRQPGTPPEQRRHVKYQVELPEELARLYGANGTAAKAAAAHVAPTAQEVPDLEKLFDPRVLGQADAAIDTAQHALADLRRILRRLQ